MPKKITLVKSRKKAVPVEIQTDPERRSILGRGVLSYRDILDQPQGKLVLVVETSPMSGSLIFSVDDVQITESSIIATVGQDKTVVTQFSPQVLWYTVANPYVEALTTEEMARRNSEDNDLMISFRETLAKTKKNGSGKKNGDGGYL